MQYNIKKMEETLLDVSKLWQYETWIERKYSNSNVRLMFDGIGKHTELLSCQLTGFVGSGSGGMGFDLIDYETKKVLEIKSCCTIQNATCNICGKKFNHIFYNKCPHCQSDDFKIPFDSRFSINSTETLNQLEEGVFNGLLMHCITLIKYTNTSVSVNIKTYLIDFNDDELKTIKKDYFIKQSENGKQATCNLLPNKYDFYKLCPTMICSYDVEFDFMDLTKEPIIIKNNVENELRVPIDVIDNRDIEKFKSLETYDETTNTVLCKDFTLHFGYKKKTHGKVRGNTRKKLYETLNQ